MEGVITLPPEPWVHEELRQIRAPRMKNYVRCAVCREKLRKGDEDQAGDWGYVVDDRVLCTDCGIAYWISHYPEMTEKEFSKAFREVM